MDECWDRYAVKKSAPSTRREKKSTEEWNQERKDQVLHALKADLAARIKLHSGKFHLDKGGSADGGGC
jgi:hypothetical protein